MKERHPPFVRTSARSRVASRAGDGKRPEPTRSWANENTQIDTGPTWIPGLGEFMDARRRRAQRRKSKVDFPAEILAARESLDVLAAAFMRRGQLGKAHGVLRERIKLLSLARFVQPLTASDVLQEYIEPEIHSLSEAEREHRHRAMEGQAALQAELSRASAEKSDTRADVSPRPSAADSAAPNQNPVERPRGPGAPGQKPEPDSTLSTGARLTRQPGDENERKENDTD